MLEGYTGLGFLAAHNASAELQLLCTGVTYRHPGLLAKIVSTLDVLSGGRAVLGIGAAWYEREHLGLGVPYPPVAERFERLEETLQIIRQMWSADDGPFEGRHYRLAETINSPQPLQTPRPRIMVGGGGEKKTLRLVAKYADACNLFAYGGAGTIRHKLEVLRRHCEDVGRNYEEIECTALGSVNLGPEGMSPDEVIEMCADLGEAGIEHMIINMPNVHEISPLETIGQKVIPTVADL
jgi:F420-dependent oxidoreductase-like protein